MFYSYTPWKHYKTFRFLTVSGDYRNIILKQINNKTLKFICILYIYFTIHKISIIYALIFRLIYSSQNVFQYISTVKMLEIDARRCSIKKLSWKIWENSQGNTCEGKTLLADLACNFRKNVSNIDVFRWFCKIFQNSHSAEHLPMVSKLLLGITLQ